MSLGWGVNMNTNSSTIPSTIPWYRRWWYQVFGGNKENEPVQNQNPKKMMTAAVSGNDLSDYSQRVQGHLANNYPELVNVR